MTMMECPSCVGKAAEQELKVNPRTIQAMVRLSGGDQVTVCFRGKCQICEKYVVLKDGDKYGFFTNREVETMLGRFALSIHQFDWIDVPLSAFVGIIHNLEQYAGKR